ncbi:unnamed protein product, partial [marine sediment metagenome]
MANLSEMKTVSDQAAITDIYVLYLDDESHSFDGQTDKLLFPTTEAEVAAVLKHAYENGTPVTIQGARTGITGAAVPMGGITINLEKMDEMLFMEYSTDEGLYSIGGQAGVILETLAKAITTKALDELKGKGTPRQQEALKQFLNESDSYFFPIDPTEMTALLGGIVACNASGARTFKHGAVRNWVRRLRVVLA